MEDAAAMESRSFDWERLFFWAGSMGRRWRGKGQAFECFRRPGNGIIVCFFTGNSDLGAPMIVPECFDKGLLVAKVSFGIHDLRDRAVDGLVPVPSYFTCDLSLMRAGFP